MPRTNTEICRALGRAVSRPRLSALSLESGLTGDESRLLLECFHDGLPLKCVDFMSDKIRKRTVKALTFKVRGFIAARPCFFNLAELTAIKSFMTRE